MELIKNPTDFRLFFLILGQAMFRDGVEISGDVLKKGEWKRSFRQLQKDLEYNENRTVKQHGIATIKRSVDRLKAEHLIDTREGINGTVFRVPEYERWQGITHLEEVKAERNAERETPNGGTKRNNKIQENINTRKINKDDDDNARVKRLNYFDNFYTAYGRQPNPKQIQILNSYIDQDRLGEEVLCFAISTASRISSHFNYLTAILNNWITKGIRTLDQAKSDTENKGREPANEPKEKRKTEHAYKDYGFDW